MLRVQNKIFPQFRIWIYSLCCIEYHCRDNHFFPTFKSTDPYEISIYKLQDNLESYEYMPARAG